MVHHYEFMEAREAIVGVEIMRMVHHYEFVEAREAIVGVEIIGMVHHHKNMEGWCRDNEDGSSL